jgi:glycogen operon protein
MLLHGDELGRTQRGNNNAYCQDNELTWVDWTPDDDAQALLAFTQRLIAIRRMHPNFRRPKFFQDQLIRGESGGEIRWLRPDGQEMSDEEWSHGWVRAIGLWLDGTSLPALDTDGNPLTDDSFLLLCNGHHEPVPFRLFAPVSSAAADGVDPEAAAGHRWEVVLDTAEPSDSATGQEFDSGASYDLSGRSLALLRWKPSVDGGAESSS